MIINTRVHKPFTDTLSVGVLFTLSSLIFATWNLVAPHYMKKFHLNYQQLGFTFAVLNFSSLIPIFLVSKIRRSLSNKILGSISAFFAILLFAFIPLYPTFICLLIGFAFLGMFIGILDFNRNLIALSIEKFHGVKIFASLYGIYSTGSIMAYFIGTLVSIFAFNLDMDQIVVSVLCIVLFLSFVGRIYHLPDVSLESTHGTESGNSGRQSWYLYFYAIMGLGLESTMEDWTSSLFAQENYHKNFSSLCLLFFAAMMFLARMYLDKARKRGTEYRLLFIACTYLLITFPLCNLIDSGLIRLVLFGLTGLAIGAIFPSSIIIMQSIAGINNRLVLARLISLTYIVYSVWPLICGTVSKYYGVAFTMTVGGSVCAVCLFVAFLKLRHMLISDQYM